MIDYYATLGVSRTATPEEIKKAYHKLAFEYHPDRHPNNETATQRFLLVDEAYRTLIDPNKRRHYDSFGSTGMPFRSENSGFNWDDFSDFFRGRSENSTRGTRTRTREAPQEPYFYNGLLLEPRAYREQNNESKKLFYFNESLDHLQQRGFERHPRPAEVFSFLADGLEGKLNDAEKAIADDMLTIYGEWLSAAFEVVPNISNRSRPGAQYLRIYPDPSLHWDGSRYEWNSTPTTPQEFDVTGKNLNQFIPLCEFDNTLVQHLYSRPFAELQYEIRNGDFYAALVLPTLNQVWPVCCGNVHRFSIGYFYDGRASRGVRSKASVPLGTQVDAQKKLHRK